jgi:hypothetical protein
MHAETDPVGNVLLRATGEDGRIVLIYDGNRVLIITERAGHLWSTENGKVTQDEFNGGKTAGIVKP